MCKFWDKTKQNNYTFFNVLGYVFCLLLELQAIFIRVNSDMQNFASWSIK